MNARVLAVEALERRIGHTFADRELLERALTHSSVGDGAIKVRHNERLEFLGDRVLGLLATERLLALYPEAKEGELSPRLANLVNGKACARVGRRLELGVALRMSGSATKMGVRDNDGALGDAVEALMAAIYIDGGLETARSFFLAAWGDEFDHLEAPRSKDAKTRLQEWAMGLRLPIPTYTVVDQSGPAHAPRFIVEVSVRGYESERGEGGSRREAEKAAALIMLLKQEGKA
ncbi:ribonuclease III [Caulobacter sp. NIBR1757]|uniref:ribonuclease III n=1 Tax=Caulobacter sp. NIBR1757 TaxID=3016000 RepID=UPI0022F0C9C4|nr:ribonuclease III [Caulobacter sp. NIBR1757]WGM39627.1 Ribonuclease 3 [Caulobacter sp. NIBR1757]